MFEFQEMSVSNVSSLCKLQVAAIRSPYPKYNER
ncbi:hypothetical protein TRP8649_02798 [Pelagimonas phthalicica]|uniref:Uncharacterized protein n=1 Tax=Pelagimonas phthalicica TaxID=1037362 RepID=A0A238JE58_9RHOB|nr:hypothetical protein CLV87_2800 [Pelagimonas phthalicica]SMX28673.1 hypothetical protein TRP8649_02798 [Pelagimonas phthalicica]